MLRLITNLPAVIDFGTSYAKALDTHVRTAVLGAPTGAAARRPEDVPAGAWAALAAAAAAAAAPCAWDASLLAAFGALALRCTEAEPEARPLMSDIVVCLEGMLTAGGRAGGAAAASAAAEALLLRVTECRICMDEPRATVFLPCFHSVACAPCAQRLLGRPCPICRVTVASAAPADGVATYAPPRSREAPPSAGAGLQADSEGGGGRGGTVGAAAALTWPKSARVALRGATGAGAGDAKRVNFPPPNAPGGTFTALQARLQFFPLSFVCRMPK